MARRLAEEVENERCGGDSDASEHVGERSLLQPPLVDGRAVLFGPFRLVGSQGVRPDHQFRQFQDILRRHLGVVVVEKDVLREDIDPRLANRRQVLATAGGFRRRRRQGSAARGSESAPFPEGHGQFRNAEAVAVCARTLSTILTRSYDCRPPSSEARPHQTSVSPAGNARIPCTRSLWMPMAAKQNEPGRPEIDQPARPVVHHPIHAAQDFPQFPRDDRLGHAVSTRRPDSSGARRRRRATRAALRLLGRRSARCRWPGSA